MPAMLLMILSGFAGLGQQMVWTQQFGVWLGHDIVAVLAVMAAFFGGIALGAYVLGRRILRQPGRWYAACELLIAAWAALLVLLMPAANAWLASLAGPQPSVLWQWTLAMFGPFFLLLPATAAMGATLPAIQHVTQRLRSEGYAIGGLYAANTLGAVLGVLAVVFFLIPALGLAGTSLACALLNLICGLCSLLLLRGDGAARNEAAPSVSHSPSGLSAAGVALWLGVTGLLGIAHEVLMVRALSQIAEDTVYTFAIVLVVYLLGTAAGALFYQRRLAACTDADALRHRLAVALCIAMLLSMAGLWGSDALRVAVVTALGSGFGPAIAGEAAMAFAVFSLPTFVMGALFSHLCVQAKDAGWAFGAAMALNTLGAALAPVLAGVLLLPAAGMKAALLLLAACYLLLLPRALWRRAPVLLPGAAILSLAVLLPGLTVVDVPPGGRIVDYREGVTAAVSVVEDAEGVTRLRINNRQQEGSSITGFADARLAYLPLLLHPAPTSALLLGLGTGVTAWAAAEQPGLAVDAVELIPEVVDAAAHFTRRLQRPDYAGTPNVIVGDARRHVRASGKSYDVIIADLFHPARSGASALYTVEHFSAIRARLAGGGVFCQWLPLHQLDMTTLRSIVAAYLAVYPDAQAVLATNSLSTPVLGLVSRPDQPLWSRADVTQRFANADRARLAGLKLADEMALLGSFVADAQALRRLAGDAPRNTDDRPTVMHRAPMLVYAAPDGEAGQRLVTLLQALEIRPASLFGAPHDEAGQQWQRRLSTYWQARARFIEVGVGVQPDTDPLVMLAQVRQPLLEIARQSADFSPAYEPLIGLANALVGIDMAQAVSLLRDLARYQPARPEAARMLARLQAPLARP
jgi:spermidine synthase